MSLTDLFTLVGEQSAILNNNARITKQNTENAKTMFNETKQKCGVLLME
jgi:hypothetical protein